MKTGDIVIASFPYTDFTGFKARPAVVVTTTAYNFGDYIVAMISSSIPAQLSLCQLKVEPDSRNNLRMPSVVNVNRLATIEKYMIVSAIGELNEEYLEEFKRLFKSLVD
jgi:mRNA interferase MazF